MLATGHSRMRRELQTDWDPRKGRSMCLPQCGSDPVVPQDWGQQAGLSGDGRENRAGAGDGGQRAGLSPHAAVRKSGECLTTDKLQATLHAAGGR